MSTSIASERADAADRRSRRIWLYDRSGHDQPLDEKDPLRDLREDQILWADVDYESLGDQQSLLDKLGITELVESLDREASPALIHGEGILHLRVKALREDDFEPRTVHAVVWPNWVLTLHDGDLKLAERFNQALIGETRIGELDGPKFLSLILDWQLTSYFTAVSSLHDRIDELDERLLQVSPDEDTLLRRLLDLRREVRRLRDLLASHRQVLGLLSHPESDVVVGSEAAADYQRLEERLQQALDEVATAREMIVGSFDIFMTRAAQATNDVMRRLTIVSILLLPAGVIAGVMGMNFKVGFFETTGLFWVVVGAMVLLAGGTLAITKARGWL
jgi:Mg2+ and Co2+ transporter CorA